MLKLYPEATTPQEMYDAVCRHLSQMPEQCSNADGCQYRNRYVPGKSTNACAIGCLLTEDEAFQNGTLITGGVMKYDIPMPDRLKPHLKFLARLQFVHDSLGTWKAEGQGPDPLNMRRHLGEIALDHNLLTDVLDEVFPPA